jgi:predicted metal-dependent peptidase
MIQYPVKLLLSEEPVFGYIVQQAKFVFDTQGLEVNTAGVSFDSSGQLIFFINPEYFLNLHPMQRVGLLYHECCHIILDHLVHYKKLIHNVANIAMDVEIDQKIPQRFLFSMPLLPISIKELNNIPDNLDFMTYYNALLPFEKDLEKYQNPHGKDGEGKGRTSSQSNPQSKDEHKWDNPQLSPEAIKFFTRNVVNTAYQQAKAGNQMINSQIESAIKDLLKPSKTPWFRVLDNLLGSVISTNRQFTRTRPNKKLEYLAPAEKDGVSPNLLFFVDVSGSHVDSLFVKSFAQIKTILDDYQDELKVFFFSDGVFDEHILVNSDLKTVPKKPGSGGTSFDDIFRKANEFDDIEAIIILTDGDAAPPKIQPSKYRVIWGLTAGDRSYLTFGDKVIIED